MNRLSLLLNMYGTMLEDLGPSRWWPGETPFEVAVGAILTQNTNWQNVEKAIKNLRQAQVLTAQKLYRLPEENLADLIRPAGYFRIKAGRLKHFLEFLKNECGFELSALASQDLETLRPKLLNVKGIGPETADSILLYALNMPSFVVDAYTCRVLHRHSLIPEDAPYEEIRSFFMDVLDPDTDLYNEYHALLVRVGKNWCKTKKPLCGQCPLNTYLENPV
ncbi:MAG: endonuclease III domain-containing protein [Thermodesulfobacteriota bacterium]|nr:endonuclease III domain-containing protein [Thermodesulfobacteriota bacterium]